MAYKKLLLQDQWIYRVAHYAPQLLYWCFTQKWFPSMSAMEEGCRENPAVFSTSDSDFAKDDRQPKAWSGESKPTRWDFDPLGLENPFPENYGNPVQIRQGCEDRIISCQIQCYVAERLPWIKYYELSDGGHLLPHNTTVVDAVLRSLLIALEPSFI
ncbi:hypothetical protein C5167_044934 [Papaver somniferum]|uniref:AB hydrolase-1 domain-containing protein n=1 Tax=Papaver somniferum TaxID=3469 RepID=A0A4Y7L9C6_PAPSO|nr:hypothetical protein C5167_044934 [Papaver somniferum]